MEPLLLGIDVGTSACKVALFRPDGTVAAQESREYPVLHPAPGWAEQNPDTWWEAVCAAIRAMLEREAIGAAQIAGVGIDGQSWSAIPVAADGRVLCNTPIWMDTRASAICDRLRDTIGEEAFFRVSGNPLQPSYTLPKLLWYKEQWPEVYHHTDKLLQSNSFIAYRLTGAISQDLSQGYGYQIFDMRKGCWDTALAAELDLPTELLPDIVPCHQMIGTVTAEAAAACGLAAGTPVVAGGLDAACGTLGAGVLEPGETQEQGGQAGGMSICMDSVHDDPRLILSYHVAPGRWLLQGGTVGGGGVMKWLQSDLWPDCSFLELDALAAAVPPGSEGVTFLPYMAGERSPLWDPDAKGVFYGLDFSKGKGHMLRAALEGVAFSLRHNLEVAQEAGAPVHRLRSMGGAANSRLWTQMKSDITGKSIDVPSADTATTLGAAILAGVAVGIYRDFSEAVAKTIQVRRSHEPEPAHKPAYDQAYARYRALYDRLKGLE